MISREFVQALQEGRRRMTQEAWTQLADRLATLPSGPDAATAHQVTADLLSRDAAWILSHAFTSQPGTTWAAIAAAMLTVNWLAEEPRQLTELIWTGPSNSRFPVRRLDQVLYDLVASARRRVVLVTFAAHCVPLLCEHLTGALQRGVEVTLVVESESESEGQLTRDALAAFRNVPLPENRVFYWPLGKRERNPAGRPGKLHMKCAIIDDAALVGSANLTDDAFNRNMELGVLIREESTVNALWEHFQELIRGGILVPVRS